jgi:D-alanyl-D-alanine carboxypeptidase
LLGLIIQKVTGHSFNDEMNQRLLGAKFGLGNTYYFPYPQAAMDHLVHGYEVDGVTDVSHFNLSWGGPGAGLISNSHDMVLWSQALFNGKVLQPAQLTEMTSLVSMKSGQPLKAGDYSLGVGLGIQSNADAFAGKYGLVYGYSGNTLGYRADFVYLPCYDSIAAVSINNVSANNKDLTEMMGEIVKAVTSSSQWQDYKKANKPDQLPAVCKKLWS